MSKRRYRVFYKCWGCGSVAKTKAKKTPKAPRKCIHCGSTQTERIKTYRVYVD